MAHLVDYEEATTEKDKAFAALECSERKSAKARAWGWAEAAIEHAVSATLCSQAQANEAAGHGRWPNLSALKTLFKKGDSA